MILDSNAGSTFLSVSLLRYHAASSFAFVTESTTEYILGSEGGSVLRCSLHEARDPKDVAKLGTPPSPILFAYKRHIGPVYGLRFHPKTRNLFASGGMDGLIRVYNVFLVRERIPCLIL
jgi:WD40 repeat protein